MQRIAIDPRPDWQKKVESVGLYHHTTDGKPYWDESACYQLRSREVDQLEEAAEHLHKLCLKLVQNVIDGGMFGLFLIAPEYEEYVKRSWLAKEPAVYGRFDFAYDGVNPPKLLEYNADTPTALVEAAVVQWYWLKDYDERGDQFNSIHERLIDSWKKWARRFEGPLHFAAMSGEAEDFVTTEYLRDTAIQAGIVTDYLDVESIGYDDDLNEFVDPAGVPMPYVFKLYPWEWMFRDEYGENILRASTRWFEPAWKSILSCKSILPLLYQMEPDCPYLLPAWFEEPSGGSYVAKPIHAREGANVTLVRDGRVESETAGPYDDCPMVYQALAPLKAFEGNYPIFGCWVVDDVACGCGIREDRTAITQNTSRFVPHQMID